MGGRDQFKETRKFRSGKEGKAEAYAWDAQREIDAQNGMLESGKARREREQRERDKLAHESIGAAIAGEGARRGSPDCNVLD